jgi:hypothetical protein
MWKNGILIALIIACLVGLLISDVPWMFERIFDTAVYAPGYSETAFRKIELVMNGPDSGIRAEVHHNNRMSLVGRRHR